MNFRRHTNYFASPRARTIIVGVIVVVLVWIGGGKILGGLLHEVALPFWQGRSGIVRTFNTLGLMSREKAALVEEVMELKTRVQEEETYEAFLASCLADLSRPEEGGAPRAVTTVHILAKPPETLYDTLVISRPRGAEFEAGDSVVSGRVLLGEVTEVFRGSALVTLFSSPERQTRATFPSGRHVDVVGLGIGNYRAELPLGVSISAGEAVHPGGAPEFLLGVVRDVSPDASGTFQTVLLRSPLNVFELTEAEVIRGGVME